MLTVFDFSRVFFSREIITCKNVILLVTFSFYDARLINVFRIFINLLYYTDK